MNESNDQLLEELRPRSFAIAYRMLGSVAEAEDVVQEALLRVNAALERGERLESPRAYVATITTRLAIDDARQPAQAREGVAGNEPQEDHDAPGASWAGRPPEDQSSHERQTVEHPARAQEDDQELDQAPEVGRAHGHAEKQER